MGKCCSCSKVGPKDEPVFVEYGDRHCTDLLCCLIFIIFWLGMVVIAATGLANGDPTRLLYGTDYQGKTCADPKLHIYYPKLTEDLLTFAQSGKTNPLDIELFGVCVDGCPKVGEVVCTAEGKTAMEAIQVSEPTWSDSRVVIETQKFKTYLRFPIKAKTVKSNCWITPLPTKDYFFRCLWQRNVTQTISNICLEPEPLKGLDLDAAAASADAEVRAQVDGCITKTQTTTTTRVGGAQQDPLLEQMASAAERMGRYVSDASKAAAVILVCGGLVALIVGFIYLLVVQSCAKFMIWLSVWLIMIFLILLTVFAYFKAGIISVETITDSFNSAAGTSVSVDTPSELQASQTIKSRWKYFAWFMTAFTLILLCIILYLRKSINKAVAIIQEAAKAVRSMPILMTFPFCSVLLLMILTVYWVLVASFVYSQGSITTADLVSTANTYTSNIAGKNLLCPYNETTGKVDNTTDCADVLGGASYRGDSVNNYLLLYHFFGLLWGVNFITGIFIVASAAAVGKWYFTKNKRRRAKMPVIQGLKMTLRYHLGSIAMGSFLIAVIQFLRAILEYVDKKTKKAQQKNPLIKAIICCLKCCLWCFEKCMKYIATNAYIVVAITGRSFISAACKAVALIVGNMKDFVLVNIISAFIFILGKIMIVVASVLLAFVWLDNDPRYGEGGSSELGGLWVPLLLTIILAYFVATAFMDVYDLAIDTILVAFLIDMGRSGAGSHDVPAYASPSLLRTIGYKDAVTWATVSSVRKLDVGSSVKDMDGAAAGAGAGAGSTQQGGVELP